MRKSFPENQNKDPDIGHPGSNSTRTGEDLPIISAPGDQLPSDEQVRSNAAQRPTNVPTSPAPASSTDQRSEIVDDNFLDVSGARNCAPVLKEPPPPPLPPPPDSQHVVEASSGPSLRCLSDSDLFPEQGSSLQHFRSGTSLLSDRRLSLQSYTMSSRGNQPSDAPGNFPTPPEATTADGVGPRDTPRAEEEALSGAPPELQPWFRDESSEPRQPPRKHVGLKGLLNTGASSVSRITYTISLSKSSQSVAEATSPPPEESLGRQPSEFATRDHFVSHSGSLETMNLLNEWPLLKKQRTEPRTTSSAAPLVSQGPSSVTVQQQINMDVMLNPSKTDAAEKQNAPHEKRLDVPKARAKSALDVRSEYDPEERPAQVAKKTRSVNLENVKEEDIIELVRFINAAFASQKSVSGTTTHSQALPCPEQQSDFIRRVDSAETSTTEEAAQISHITNYEKVKDVWSSALLTEEFILGRQQPPQLFPVIVADKSLTKLKTEKDLAPQQVIQVKGTRVKRGSESYDVIIKFPSMEVLLRKPSADKPKEVIYGAGRKGSVSEKENQASASSWLGEFFTAADAPRVGSTIEKFKQGHETILPLTETEAGSQAGATKSSKGEPAIQSNTALEFDRDEMLPFFEENAPFFYSNMEHGKNKNELQQQKAPKGSGKKNIAPQIIQSAKIGVETAEPDRKIELPKPQYQERISLQIDSGMARAGEKETPLSIEMLQQVEVNELAAHARTVITTASTKDCRIQVAAGLHLDIPDVQIPGQKRQDQNLQVSDGTLPAVVFPLEVAEQAKQLKVTPVSEEAPEMSLEIPALKHPVVEVPEVEFPAGEECFPDGIKDIQGKELEARTPVEGPLNVASDAISGAILPSIIREELPSSLGTSGDIEEQNIIEEISEPLPDNTKLFVKMTITPVVSDVDFVPRTSQDLSKEALECVSETHQRPMPSEFSTVISENTVTEGESKTEDKENTMKYTELPTKVPAPKFVPDTHQGPLPSEYYAEQSETTVLHGKTKTQMPETVIKHRKPSTEVPAPEPVSETHQEHMPSEYYAEPREVTVLQEEVKTEDQQTTKEVPAPETFPGTQPEHVPSECYAERNKNTLLLGEAVTEDQETTREVRGSEPVSETDQEPMPSEYYVGPSEVTVLQEEVKTEDQQTTIEVQAPETFPETQPEHMPLKYHAERNKDTLLPGEAVTKDQETTREVRGSEPVSETDQEPMPSEYYVGPSEVTVLQEEIKTEDQQTTIEVTARETFPETQPERMPLEYYAEQNKDTLLLGEAVTEDQETTREVRGSEPVSETDQEPMPSEYYVVPSEVTVLQEEVKTEDQQTTIEVPAPETFPETQPEHVPSEYYAERNKDTLLLGEAVTEDQETTREVRGSEPVSETDQEPMPSEYYVGPSEVTVLQEEVKTEDQQTMIEVQAPETFPETQPERMPLEYYAERNKDTVLLGEAITKDQETREVPAPKPIPEIHQEPMPSEFYAGPSEVTVLQEEVKAEDQQTMIEVPAPETFPETQPEHAPSEYYAERNKDTLLLGEAMTEDQETTREVRGSEPVSETHQEPLPSEYYVGPSEVTALQEEVKTEDQQTTIEVQAPETFPETQPERMPLEYYAERNKDTLLLGEAMAEDQETREVRGSEPVSETDQEPMPSEYYVGPSEVTVLQEEVKTEDQQTTIEVQAPETFPETQPERMPLEYYAERNKDTLLLGEAMAEDQETREVRGSEPVSETDQEPMPSEYYVRRSEVTALQEEVKTEDQQTMIEVPAPETFPETQPERMPLEYYAERNKDTLLLGEAMTEDQETTREVRGSEPVFETHQEPIPSQYYVGPSEVTVLQEEVKTEDQQTTIKVSAPEPFLETQPESVQSEYYAWPCEVTVLQVEAMTEDQQTTRELRAPEPVPGTHQEPMPSEYYTWPNNVTMLQGEAKTEDQPTRIEVQAAEHFPEIHPEPMPSEYFAGSSEVTVAPMPSKYYAEYTEISLPGKAVKKKGNLLFVAEREVPRKKIQYKKVPEELSTAEVVPKQHVEPMLSEYYAAPTKIPFPEEAVKEKAILSFEAECKVPGKEVQDKEVPEEQSTAEVVPEHHVQPMPSEYYAAPTEIPLLEEAVKEKTILPFEAEREVQRKELQYEEVPQELSTADVVSDQHVEPMPSEYYATPPEIPPPEEAAKEETILPFGAECEVPGEEVKYKEVAQAPSTAEVVPEHHVEPMPSEYYAAPTEILLLEEAVKEKTILPFEAERVVQRKELQYEEVPQELSTADVVSDQHVEPMPSEYYATPPEIPPPEEAAKGETILPFGAECEVPGEEVKYKEVAQAPSTAEVVPEHHVEPMPSEYYAAPTEILLLEEAVKEKTILPFEAERVVQRKELQYEEVPQELSTADVVSDQHVEPMPSEYYATPPEIPPPQEAAKEETILPFGAECEVPGEEVKYKEVAQEPSTVEVVPEHHVEPMPSEYYAAPTEILLLEEAVKEKTILPFEAERVVQRKELQYEEVPQELSTADVVSDQRVEPMPSEYYATPPEIPPPEEAAKEETILPFGAECEVPGEEVKYKEVAQEPSTVEVVPEHHVEPMPSEYYAAPTEILLLEEAVKEKTILPFEAEREVQRKELQYEEVPQELSTADVVSDQHVEPMPSEYYATPPEIPPPQEAAKEETILPFGAECEVPGEEVKYKEVAQEPSTAEVVPEHHVEPMPPEYYAAPTEILLLEEAVKEKTILPFEAEREVQRKELQYEEVPQELSTADVVSDQHVEPMPSEYYATPPEIPPPEAAAKEETILPFGAECEVPGKEVQYKEVPQEPSTAEVVPEQLVEPMPSEYWAAHIDVPFPAEAVKVKEILQIKAQTEVLEKEVHQTDLLSELPAAEVVPENAEELIPSEYSTAPAGTPIQMEEIKYKILPFQKKEPKVPVEKVQYEKLPSELFSDEASFEQYEEHATSVCYAAPCEIPLEDIEKEKDILIPAAVYALEQHDEHMPSEHSAATAEILLPVDAVKDSIPPITEVELQVPDEELEYKELPSEVPAADIVLEQYAEPMPPEYYATAVDIYYPKTVKEKTILPLDAEPAVTEKGMPYNEVPSQLPSTEAVLKTFVDSMPSDYNATHTDITLPEERLNGKEIFPVERTEREISGEKALYAAMSSESPTIETVLEQCVEPMPSEYYATPKEIRLPVALEENEILSFEATPKIPTDELQEKGLLSELTAVEDVLERYTKPMPSEYYYIPAEVLPVKPIKDEIVPFLASKSDVPRKEIEYKELPLKLSAAQDVLEQFIEPMPSEYYAASIESPYPNKTRTDKEILISEAEPETLVKELQCKQVASEFPMANMPPTDVLAKEKEMSLFEGPRPYKPGEGVKYEKLHSASESAKLDLKEDLEFLPPQLIAACSEISPLSPTSVDVDGSASETDTVSVEALKRGSAEVLKYLKFIDKMVTVEPLPEEALISVKAEFDQLSFLPDKSDFSKEAQERPKLSSSENDINLPVPLGIVTRRILRETTVTEEFQKLFPLQPGILCSSYQGKVDESGGPRLQSWEPTEHFDVITTRKETKTKEKVEYTEPYKNEDFDTTEISLDSGSVSRGASDEYHTKTIVLQCNKEEEVKYAEPLSSFCSCVPEELGTEVSNTATRNECVVHTEDTTGTCDRFHEEYLTRAAKKATVVKETFQVIKPFKPSKRALSSTKEECLPGTSQDTKQGNKLTKALSKSIVLIELREDTRPRKKLSVEADLNKRLLLTGDVPTDEAGKEHEINVSIDGRALDKDPSKSSDNFTITQIELFPGTSLDQGTAPFTEFQDELPSVDELEQRFRPPMGLHRDLLSLHEFDIGAARDHRKHISSMEGGEKTITASSDEPTFPSRIKLIDTPANEHPVEATPIEKDYFPSSDTEGHETGKIKQKFHLVAPSVHKGELVTLGERSLVIPTSESSVELMQAEKYAIATDISGAETVPASHRQKSLDEEFQSSHAAPAYKLVPGERSLVPVLDIAADGALAEYCVENSHIPAAGTVPAVEPQAFRTEDIQTLSGASVHLAVPGEKPVVIPTLQSVVEVMPAEYYSKAVETSIAEAVLAAEPQKPVSQNFEPMCAALEYKRAIEEQSALLPPWRKIVEPMSTERSLQVVEIPSVTVLPGEVQQLLDKEVEPSYAGLDEIKVVVPTLEKKAEALPPEPDQKNYEMLGTKMVPETEPHNLVYEEFEPTGYEHTPKDMSTAADLALPTPVESTSTEHYEEVQRMSTMDTLADLEQTRHEEIKGSSEGDAHQGATLPTEISLPVEYYTASSEVSTAEAIAGARREKPSTKEIEPRYAAAEYNVPQVRQESFPGALNVVPGEYLTPSNSSSSGMLVTPEYSDTETMNGVDPMSMRESERRLLEWYPSIEVSHEAPQPSEVMEPLELPWRTLSGPPTKLALLPLQEGIEYASLSSIEYLSEDLLESYRNTGIMSSLADVQSELFMSNGAQEPREDLVAAPPMEVGSALCGKRRSSDVSDWLQEPSTSQVKELTTHQEQTAVSTLPATSTGVGHIPWTSQLDELASDSTPVDELKSAEVNKTSSREAEPVDALDPAAPAIAFSFALVAFVTAVVVLFDSVPGGTITQQASCTIL